MPILEVVFGFWTKFLTDASSLGRLKFDLGVPWFFSERAGVSESLLRMLCLNCGRNIGDENQFCADCSAIKDEIRNKQQASSQKFSDSIRPTVSQDEDSRHWAEVLILSPKTGPLVFVAVFLLSLILFLFRDYGLGVSFFYALQSTVLISYFGSWLYLMTQIDVDGMAFISLLFPPAILIAALPFKYLRPVVLIHCAATVAVAVLFGINKYLNLA